MPLHVPSTHPIIPVLVYDPAMPPALPHVHVPVVVQGIVPFVAVELINQLGMKSSNSPVRMAGYNLAVMNGFLNNEFKELLELTCQSLVLNYKKGYIRSPQEGIQQVCTDTLALWLSNLVLIHPELKAACSPQIVHAAYQNAPVFQNLKTEIMNMNNQYQPVQQPYPQQQQPMQVNQWGTPNQMYPNQTPPNQIPPGRWVTNQYGQQVFVPDQPGYQQVQQPYQPNQGYPVQGQPYQQAPQHQAWGGGGFQYQRPVMGDPRVMGGYAPNVVEASNIAKDAALQSRFMGQLNRNRVPGQELAAGPTPAPPPPTHAPAQQYAPIQAKPVQYQAPQVAPQQTIAPMEPQPLVEPETKELKIKGGSEMDRANHAVAYFGEEVKDATTEKRQEVFSKSAEELAHTSASTLELPDGVEEEANASGVEVSNKVLYDVTEESLLLVSKIKYLEARDGETPSPMFRIFGHVANPFVGRKVLTTLLSNLLSVNGLSKLADRMKTKMRDALAGKGGLRGPDDQDTIAYLNFLDAYLTKKVNSILLNNLKANLRISSFTADVSGITDFLAQKRSQSMSYAWDKLATALFTRYVDGFNNEMEATVHSNYSIPEDLCTVITPMSVSYTFTELTLSELGFEFTDSPVDINPQKAPALYKIALSLAKHKREMELDTDIDYLVTADGAKYALYKNHAVTGESFLISDKV